MDQTAFIQLLIDKGIISKDKAQEALNQPSNFSNNYYDKTRNTALEDVGETDVAGVGKSAGIAGLVDPNFIKNNIANHPDIIGFYVNAMTYGGYTSGDVLNDIKRRELESKGDTNAKKLKIISPTENKTTYQKSAAGTQSVKDTATYIPTFSVAGLLDPEILNYGANIPDELYTGMSPLMDENSQEFKDAVEEIKSLYWDMENAKLQATNEQELAVANEKYNDFKKQLNEKYGIILSDNADKAWKQIEDLGASFGTRGLMGSGLQSEAIDTSLTAVRKEDERSRHDKLDTEEAAKAAKLKATGTPEEIAALTPEERAKYGLTPSADVLALLDKKAIREKYPDMTDKEIDAYVDSKIDANGNYRSTIYQKYYDDLNKNRVSEEDAAKVIVRQTESDRQAREKQNLDAAGVFNTISAGNKGVDVSVPGSGADGTTEAAGDYPPADQTGGDYPPSGYPVIPGSTNQTNSNVSGNITSGGTSGSSGYTDQQTKNLQDYLVRAGYMTQKQVDTGYGTYGPQTTAALKKYQDDKKLSLNVAGLTPTTVPLATTTINQTPAYTASSTNMSTVKTPTPSAVPNYSNLMSTIKNPTPAATTTPYKAPVSTYTAPMSTVKTPTPAAVAPTAPKSGYTGGSIVDYLNSTGGDSSYSARAKIAGSGYTGTAAQNAALLKQMRGY